MEYAILKAPQFIFKSHIPDGKLAQVVDSSNARKVGEPITESIVFSDGVQAIIYYPASKSMITVLDESGKHGIFRNKAGLLHPVKGISDPDISYALNGVKQVLMAILTSLSWRNFVGFIFSTGKTRVAYLENLLSRLLRPFSWLLGPYFFKDPYYGAFSTELRRLIYVFLMTLGVSSRTASGFSEIIALIFDCDDAYRYKAEDVFSCTNRHTLSKEPRKEIHRLLMLLLHRTISDPHDKFSRPAKALSFLLWFPSVKNAFVKAVNSVDFMNLQPDTADSYHMLYRSDYNFQGRSFEDRYEELRNLHNGNLPDAIRI